MADSTGAQARQPSTPRAAIVRYIKPGEHGTSLDRRGTLPAQTAMLRCSVTKGVAGFGTSVTIPKSMRESGRSPFCDKLALEFKESGRRFEALADEFGPRAPPQTAGHSTRMADTANVAFRDRRSGSDSFALGRGGTAIRSARARECSETKKRAFFHARSFRHFPASMNIREPWTQEQPMRRDARLLWGDPVDQLLSLRISLKCLLTRGLNPRERFDRATFPLVKYQPSEFPEQMRPAFERLMQARIAVRQDYIGSTIFDFSRLSVTELRSLQNDVIALFEACLLDIGRMSKGSATGSNDYDDILYPQEPRPSAKRVKKAQARRRRKSKIAMG